MNSGDINVNNINGIPVMKFKDLNTIINVQYRGYRSTSGFVSLASNNISGNMNVGTFANSLYSNVGNAMRSDPNKDKVYGDPYYITKDILPFNN
jgi:hypothetical protein